SWPPGGRVSLWIFPQGIPIRSEIADSPPRHEDIPMTGRSDILTAVLAEAEGPVTAPWPLPAEPAPLWAARDDEEEEPAEDAEDEDEDDDDEDDDFDDLDDDEDDDFDDDEFDDDLDDDDLDDEDEEFEDEEFGDDDLDEEDD